jgi:hypothetical protein
MERLFSPSTRYQDKSESHGLFEEFRSPPIQELNLEDVSVEELLSTERASSYGNFYAMLENKDTVAWLTPRAAVARQDETVVYSSPCLLSFNTDNDKYIIALARYPEHLLEICDVVLRLLAVSIVHSVILDKCGCFDVALINAPTLAYLLEQCQSLKALTLEDLVLDEEEF